MVKASWGYCVPVFDFSSKPAALPRIGGSAVPGASETELEIGRTTLCDESANITMNPPVDLVPGSGQFCPLY